MTDNAVELQQEIDRLRDKNAELLNEVKTYKAKTTESATELEKLRLEVRGFKLNGPVESVIEDLFVISPGIAMKEIEADFKFDLDEAGQVTFRDGEGNPVLIGDGDNKREAAFTKDDVKAALWATSKWDKILRANWATGGGAQGGERPSMTQKAPAGEAKGAGFGLR